MAVRKIKEKIENVELQDEKLSDMKKLAERAALEPKKDIFKFILRQWQFWALIFVILIACAFSIITSTSTKDIIAGQASVQSNMAVQPNMVGQTVFKYMPTFAFIIIMFGIYIIGVVGRVMMRR